MAEAATDKQEYDWEEIGKHTSQDDCWIVVKGQVLDVSNFHEKHPGKTAVYRGAGKDATELMASTHQGSGHDAKAYDWLQSFVIGTVKQ